MINKTDKSRSSYYNYYTNKKWGSADSYNLCLDSSKLGIDGTAKAIIEAIHIYDSLKKIKRQIFYRHLHFMAGCFSVSAKKIQTEFILMSFERECLCFFLDTNRRCYVIITWWRKLL